MESSSASGGCQGGSVSGAGTKDKEECMDLEECGMAPFLALDKTGEGEFSVCHVVALQTLKLKAIEAELVETADDDMILMTLGEDIVPKFHELNDVWKVVMYKDATSGKVYVHQKASGKTLELSTFRSRHQVMSCEVNCTSSAASASVDCYKMLHPRAPNQRIFWSMHSLYQLLGLTGYQGKASRWSHFQLEKMQKRMAPMHHVPQMIFGWYVAVISEDKRGSLPYEDRCLPAPSVSTFGLIINLMTWSSSPPNHGGFKEDESRMHAKQLLRRLLDVVNHLHPNGVEVPIFGEDGWYHPWPRHPPHRLTSSAVKLRWQDGFMECDDIARFAQEHPRSTMAEWWASLQVDSPHSPMPEFLIKLARSTRATSMWSQVASRLAIMVEEGLLRSTLLASDPASMPPPPGLALTVLDLCGLLEGGNRDHVLYEYVMAGRRASKGMQYLHMAMDKGVSGNLQLLFTCFTLGDLAVVACPQASK